MFAGLEVEGLLLCSFLNRSWFIDVLQDFGELSEKVRGKSAVAYSIYRFTSSQSLLVFPFAAVLLQEHSGYSCAQIIRIGAHETERFIVLKNRFLN